MKGHNPSEMQEQKQDECTDDANRPEVFREGLLLMWSKQRKNWNNRCSCRQAREDAERQAAVKQSAAVASEERKRLNKENKGHRQEEVCSVPDITQTFAKRWTD